MTLICAALAVFANGEVRAEAKSEGRSEAMTLDRISAQHYEKYSDQLKIIASDAFQFAPPLELGTAMSLWSTYYYVHPAKAQAKGVALLDVDGKPISAPVSEQDFCLGALEGTISIQGGPGKPAGETVTYNFLAQAKQSIAHCEKHVALNAPWVKDLGKARFRNALGPYGDGVALPGSTTSTRLVPLRSIATDPTLIPTGKVLYIPAARGLTFKTAQGQKRVHDGYFFAVDVGPAILGNHMDLFIGPSLSNPFPTFVKSEAQSTFPAYIVNSAAIIQHMKKLHCHSGANSCP